MSSTGDRGCRDVPKGERIYEDFLSPSIKGKLGLHQVEESGREALRADFTYWKSGWVALNAFIHCKLIGVTPSWGSTKTAAGSLPVIPSHFDAEISTRSVC